MKPVEFRPWAEEQFAKSPAVADVTGVQDDRPENAHITYTHVTFPTGAKVVVHWLGGDPLGGKNKNPDGSIAETGPPPEPVPVPELPVAGRLKTVDVENHLAALLHNGGHERVAWVRGNRDREKLRDDQQPQYGVKVTFHSGETILGLLEFTLRPGQQPTEQMRYQQSDEI